VNLARPHASHDLSLIAAAAAGDLADAALRDADALAASCPDCAALLSDLVAIAAATRSLPDPIRPRSFTLSDEQAARLRPTGWRRFGRPRLERTRMARPVALACTTLGLAGLLLATLPATPTGFLGLSGGAAAPGVTGSESLRIEDDRANVHEPSPSPQPVYGQAAGGGTDAMGSPVPGTSHPPEAAPGPSTEPVDRQDVSDEVPGDPASEVTTGTPNQWLAVLSLALLAGGLGVFVLTRERRRED
jgi:hypothetical protein